MSSDRYLDCLTNPQGFCALYMYMLRSNATGQGNSVWTRHVSNICVWLHCDCCWYILYSVCTVVIVVESSIGLPGNDKLWKQYSRDVNSVSYWRLPTQMVYLDTVLKWMCIGLVLVCFPREEWNGKEIWGPRCPCQQILSNYNMANAHILLQHKVSYQAEL